MMFDLNLVKKIQVVILNKLSSIHILEGVKIFFDWNDKQGDSGERPRAIMALLYF